MTKCHFGRAGLLGGAEGPGKIEKKIVSTDPAKNSSQLFSFKLTSKQNLQLYLTTPNSSRAQFLIMKNNSLKGQQLRRIRRRWTESKTTLWRSRVRLQAQENLNFFQKETAVASPRKVIACRRPNFCKTAV